MTTKQSDERCSDLQRVRAARTSDRPVLITGGAGFVGTNLAHRLLSAGKPVIVFDNLSRPGVERNLGWLREVHGSRVQAELADVRDPAALLRVVREAEQVFHLAAQVAVTTSLADPLHDFEVNARGTLNLLSALNTLKDPPPLVFTSTNKVYGGLDDVELIADGRRYEPVDARLRAHGIGETRRLDFHSPYGCSKGTADQYVIDYARSFGLRTVVFRMSCIYGPHQFGTEDQGWVAHFLIRALKREPITIFGDGMQVRDLLFVDDLIDAFLRAQSEMPKLAGHVFNIGGGAANATSVVDVLDRIGDVTDIPPAVHYEDWRPGDQRYYVSDNSRFQKATGWAPRVDVGTGLQRLRDWLQHTGVAAPAARTLATERGGARRKPAAQPIAIMGEL